MSKPLFMTMTASVSAVALMAGAAIAAPPPADTIIGNQAAATYEANGESFVVESNLVETIVNEVYGVDLADPLTKEGAPGGFAFFPHTITNTGNTDDTFSLTADPAGGTDAFTLTGVEIFADVDGDGQPDSTTPITASPSVPAGETFGIVVRAAVPTTATNNTTSDFAVTVTSDNDPTATETFDDLVRATTNGIIEVTKDQSLIDNDGNGVFTIGDQVEVTLRYTNSGIAAATNVVVTDILPDTNAAGEAIDLDYTAGSGVWSLATGALTDDAVAAEPTSSLGDTIAFEWDNDRTITAAFASVPAGRSGEVTFRYTITAAPEGTFENVATFVSDGNPASTPSNPSPIEVQPSVNLNLADAESDAAGTLLAANASTTDDDGALDDSVEEVDDAFPGQSLAFDFVLTNLSNGTDTFDLIVANGDFPAGTIFDIVGDDGLTPIIGDEITLPAGSSTHVQVRAILPLDAAPVAAPAGYDATFTATSQTDPTVSNTSEAIFNGAILQPAVDLENLDALAGMPAGGSGVGSVDNAGAAWNTATVNPGETAIFPMRITVAQGSPSNSFDLKASTDQTFAAITLPTDFSVVFYDATGTPITSTGAIVPTATADGVFEYEAHVTVADSAAASLTPGELIYFQAISPTNGATDSKLDAVIVNEVSDLRLTSDTVGQAEPGGFTVFTYLLTNDGNTTITGAPLNLEPNEPFSNDNMTPVMYYDANGDGVLDASDPQITDVSQILGTDDPSTPGLDESAAGLSPNEAAMIFVRVQVDPSVPAGTTGDGDVSVGTTLTTPNGTITDTDPSNNTVDHLVTVVSGDVEVRKEQALDADCDGAGLTPFTITQQSADPGNCVVYRVTVDNVGTTDATNMVINDVTPTFTTFEDCGAACSPVVDIDGTTGTLASVPADGATGAVTTTAATLPPARRATLTFTVRIDE